MNLQPSPSTAMPFLLLCSLLSASLIPGAFGQGLRCVSVFDCQHTVREGSECVNGYCTNPYHNGGCLASRLPDHHRVRTCGSEDPPEAAAKGFCKPSSFDYPEIRIGAQNWESPFFETWILQILLSEMMEVPVSVETGVSEGSVSFYDLNTRMTYGSGNTWDAFRTVGEYKDCRAVPKLEGDDYIPCHHVLPEVWTGHKENLDKLENENLIEPPSTLGALGSQSWFIPRRTAAEDPTLLTYLGIQGEDNRAKLAATFQRPTTWEDYCLEESANNCEAPDGVATRPPTEEEKDYYFGGEEFIGYFRNTTQNNCSGNDQCTGHIVDYPCGWSSFVAQQAYHLDIALESNGKEPGSNGYSYQAMTQIWAAANRTRSNVMMQWWSPEKLYQEYIGTDYEFQRVQLPPPTQECVENRVNPLDRCSADPAVRVGSALGACNQVPHALFKITSTVLYDLSFDPEKSSSEHSPAYDAVKNFEISDLQIGEIFDLWFASGNELGNLDPRDAVCQWVVENFETVESWIPRSHPRIIQNNHDVYREPIYYVSIVLSVAALVGTAFAAMITYIQREKQVMKFAQVEFIFLLLVGLSLISIGSLFNAMPPNDGLCVSIAWLVNYGYTFELVPLIVKIAALNRMMIAAQQMRRLELTRVSLWGSVITIAFIVGVVLAIWTATDPPQEGFELKTTDKTHDYGETIVERTSFCESDTDVWNYLAVLWQLLLLLCASVLAFTTRKAGGEDVNETRTLAMLIYSQFVFVVLRVVTYLMDNSVDHSDLTASRSIIYSCDVLAIILIYFVPKFYKKDEDIQITPLVTAPTTKNPGNSKGTSSKGTSSPNSSQAPFRASVRDRIRSFIESEEESDHEEYTPGLIRMRSHIASLGVVEEAPEEPAEDFDQEHIYLDDTNSKTASSDSRS